MGRFEVERQNFIRASSRDLLASRMRRISLRILIDALLRFLDLGHAGEDSIEFQQFIECSRFNDTAMLDHHDPIRVLDRRQPVRHDDSGGVEPADAFRDRGLRGIVQSARSLIKNHDPNRKGGGPGHGGGCPGGRVGHPG